MVHYVYLVENLVNGKIYIGKHSTEDVDDGYMGSGLLLTRAIAKYGVESFRKRTVAFFDTSEEAFAFEASLVDDAFVHDPRTYNLTLGGNGCWSGANRHSQAKDRRRRGALSMNKVVWADPEYRARKAQKAGETFARLHAEGLLKPVDWTGHKHKAESKAKIGAANSVHQAGEGNSRFGSVWVHHLADRVSKSVPKSELETWLSQGWTKGRRMKW